MFWDGSRWVDERASSAAPATIGAHRLRDWIATIPILLLVPALLFPFLATLAGGPALSVSGTPTPGQYVTVSGSGFSAGMRVQLQWDGSTKRMPLVTVSSSTKFTTRFRIPSSASLGDHTLTAMGLRRYSGWRLNQASPLASAKTLSDAATSVRAAATATAKPAAPSPTRAGRYTEQVMLVKTKVKVVKAAAPSPSGSVPTTAPTAPAAGIQADPPTATPTTAPTVPPTAPPTQAPTTAPTAPPAAPAAACPSNVQTAVNATATGGTLNLTGCGPYSQSVRITRAMTVIGLVNRNVAAANQRGGTVLSGSNINLLAANLSGGTGGCLGIEGGGPYRIDGSSFTSCGQAGILAHGDFSGVGRINGLTITNSRLLNNDTAHQQQFWEAGGIKIVAASNVTFGPGNEVAGNDGPGVWCDVDCSNFEVTGNRVHHNTYPGIMFEISDGAHIHGNAVWENGWSFVTWGWGGGILVSSSKNAEVDHNTVAWNADGISVLSQNRGTTRWNGVTGINVHDNVVVMGPQGSSDSSNDRVALGYLQDWAGTMFASGSGNRGTANGFSATDAYGRYQWNGALSSVAALNGTPAGGGNSVALSAAQRDAALNAAGMPLAQASH
jgi:hypothetical protein